MATPPHSSSPATRSIAKKPAAAKPTRAPAKNAAAASVPAEDDGLVRLNVYLQEQGIASRRKADTMIEQGRVQVDGVVTKKLGTRIPSDAVVKVDGKALKATPLAKVVFLLNKPDLCLTSRSDTQGRKTIFDLPALHRVPRNAQAVGRLDYRSEGLLLLTNDGDLAFALTHPRFSVEKSYAVLVADAVNAEDIDRLRKGVMLDDGFAKPLTVRLGSKEKMGASRGQWVEIVVTEGRNRLIRRMMETLGLKVVRLVRMAIGDVRLPERLGEGQLMTVVGAELAYLNRVKLDMLKERDGLGAEKGPAGSPLTAADRLKRRLKRKLTLNDEEYLEERQRSSAALGARRRERKEAERDVPAAAAAAPSRARPARDDRDVRPVRDDRTVRDTRPARDDRPARDTRPARDERPARDTRPARDDRPARDTRPARDERPARDTARDSTARAPTPRPKPADAPRPAARRNETVDAPRPAARRAATDDKKPARAKAGGSRRSPGRPKD